MATQTAPSAEQEQLEREELDYAEEHSENRLTCVIARELRDGKRKRGSDGMYAHIGRSCRDYRRHHRLYLEHRPQ
jgi:hypothetical protein